MTRASARLNRPAWLATTEAQALQVLDGLKRRAAAAPGAPRLRPQCMGALLRNTGEFVRPPGCGSPGGGFARQVDKHGAGLDRVLCRRDFHELLRLSGRQLEGMLDMAAAEVRDLLAERHDEGQGALEVLLPPGWRQPACVYDGVTVFFDPTDAEAQSEGCERFYLALLMQLRSRTDFKEERLGECRMALLGSLVCIGWSFGGMGFWPVPVAGTGSGESPLKVLDSRFWAFRVQDAAFRKFVCPLRLPFRLALEALLLATGAALLAYGWTCRVRRLGPLYLLGLWAAGTATLSVASAVFTFDPCLNSLRKGKVPLLVLILVRVVGGVVFTFKRRVEDP